MRSVKLSNKCTFVEDPSVSIGDLIATNPGKQIFLTVKAKIVALGSLNDVVITILKQNFKTKRLFFFNCRTFNLRLRNDNDVVIGSNRQSWN